MDSKFFGFIEDKKKVLTRVILVYISLRIFLQLFAVTININMYLENSLYPNIVFTLTGLIVSVIGLIGFIKVNQMMCALFLSYIGIETINTLVNQIRSMQIVLEKYSFVN